MYTNENVNSSNVNVHQGQSGVTVHSHPKAGVDNMKYVYEHSKSAVPPMQEMTQGHETEKEAKDRKEVMHNIGETFKEGWEKIEEGAEKLGEKIKDTFTGGDNSKHSNISHDSKTEPLLSSQQQPSVMPSQDQHSWHHQSAQKPLGTSATHDIPSGQQSSSTDPTTAPRLFH
jgi:hypothetical protein